MTAFISSLHTNILTEDGTHTALQAIENWENNQLAKKIWNSFSTKTLSNLTINFTSRNRGTKMAPSYANIFMSMLKSRIFSETNPSPYTGRDTYMIYFQFGPIRKKEFTKSINKLPPWINFTAEFSTDEIMFLGLSLYKGEKFV